MKTKRAEKAGMEMNRYEAVDRFRLIAAMLVAAIHTSPLSSWNGQADFILTRIAGRVAVPFFFISTGYFMESCFPRRRFASAERIGIGRQVGKILRLYGAAILLYLPLNLYTGYFSQGFTVGKLLKDIIFDGTFYHLWYLPAAAAGLGVAWALLKLLNGKAALAAGLFLYGLGLLGDSYYGLTAQLPWLGQIYEGMFRLFDYTRNGLFMAPVFILEGVYIGRFWKNPGRKKPSFGLCTAALAASGVMMLAEGLLLQGRGWLRHDSMYIMLPAAAGLLFVWLLELPDSGKGLFAGRRLRSAATVIYLIHPWMIVAVRGAAKVLHLEWLLIEQSLAHYLAVLAASGAAAGIWVAWTEHRRGKRLGINFKICNGDAFKNASAFLMRGARHATHDILPCAPLQSAGGLSQMGSEMKCVRKEGNTRTMYTKGETEKKQGFKSKYVEETEHSKPICAVKEGQDSASESGAKKESTHWRRAWAEVNLQAICHNAEVLKGMLPSSCRLMAVVKADGYGHGGLQAAKALSRAGIRSFAVATLEEGLQLRKGGLEGEILILGYTDPQQAAVLEAFHLMQTVVDGTYGQALNAAAAQTGKPVNVHIGIDTGMHRLGIPAEDMAQVERLYGCAHLKICGIFSHLCVSDSLEQEDVFYTHGQLTRFFRLINRLKEKGLPTGDIHIQASFGIVNYPDLPCDCARAGIALYGALSGEKNTFRTRPDLRPALSLHACVGAVKNVTMGESVSYGRTFTAAEDIKIAAVTIGYADGIPRNLSGSGAWVLINGQKAPVIGRVCMDQLMVNVSHIDGVYAGDKVTLIGKDGQQEITCEMFSQWCGTIPNEILSRLGSRVARVYDI